MYTPTPTLKIRSSKTSDDSEHTTSDYCKTHKNSDLCQKPVNDDVLTITLSILLPLIAIVCVLGYFLYRNYRKDKKESMEHDPDFDENGEATALPDFPELKGYSNQNPFNNNARYPMDHQFRNPQYQQYPPPHGNDAYSQYSQDQHPFQDPYTFVLPYQHQTGSKVSLDDYARTLGDSQGYKTSVSSAALNQLDNSSSIHSFHNNVGAASSTPLRRSNLYMEHSRTPSDPVSPTRNQIRVPEKAYYGSKVDDTPMVAPNIHDDSYSSSELHFEKDADTTVVIPQIIVQDEEELNNIKTSEDTDGTERSTSPFDSDSEVVEHGKEHESTKTSSIEGTNEKLTDPRHHHFEASNETFDFSQSDRIEDDSHEELIKKSPPMMQLNNEIDSVGIDELTDEQEEQIKRMKSVYNVYFDSDKTRNSTADKEVPPLPQITQLQSPGNVRYSTSSSVYDNPPDVTHQSFSTYPAQSRPQPRLPPLKPLPNASDIRKSTIETYTNYRPKVASPQFKHFMPIEGDVNESGYYSPPLSQPQSPIGGPVPSASQLARNSVVMIDPAVEMTKSRTFKPAGSPTLPQSASMTSFGESQMDHDNDFKPGSRRSDVRRILNNH
ncbi:uncharacterized protein SPAPADRAFT_58763 [Spathaspora passalidarum NRRL Y-27907]|uniref:Uncharacterized protein n=1 Tax=Spathaspora passalidarum (strain NRRL Y-27907 / 11-Y1) TaxID=619300 RepID=G3AHA8_SPAPN|nr:uncharacterized protein SPAPADRAFT_58763 [Spathaspora passalidarum NRRL Y-27907]EGW35538.1 hypothetical protein SPAPADRAFT_58763 [Spathaspora passalidarum NRRL Y-27907]